MALSKVPQSMTTVPTALAQLQALDGAGEMAARAAIGAQLDVDSMTSLEKTAHRQSLGLKRQTRYKSPYNPERMGSLEVSAGASAYIHYSVISMQTPAMAAGDVLRIDAYCQIRHEHDYMCQCGYKLARATSPAAAEDASLLEYLSRPRGSNFDRAMHYYVPQDHAYFVASAATAPFYVNFIVQLASTAATFQDTFTLLQGYGEMNILHYHD